MNQEDPMLSEDPPRFSSFIPSPTEPAFAEITTLARWLRRGKDNPRHANGVFHHPFTQFGPKYNALVTLTRDRARKEAHKAQAELLSGKDKGPLPAFLTALKT